VTDLRLLEHVIRAAATIAGDTETDVIGSPRLALTPVDAPTRQGIARHDGADSAA